jgi:hypothetical protein
MPNQPGDAGRADVVCFPLRPISPPTPVGHRLHMQTYAGGPPQAFGRCQAVQVISGQLPGRFLLAQQVAEGFMGG